MTDQSLNRSTESLPLRPHQQEIINKLCNKKGPRRLVLSSPAGLGKATALAAAAGLLSNKKRKFRCLVVVPAALALEWKANLERFTDLDVIAITPQYYRFLQAKTSKDANVWSTISIVVIPIDFLKVAGRIEEVIAEKWDLVLVDEAHHYSIISQRGHSALGLWQSPKVAVAVALTATPDSIDWLPLKPRITCVRWNYQSVFPRNEIPRRHIHVVRYTSEFELEATKRIYVLVEQISPKVKRTTAARQRAKWLWASILLNRLSSSAFTFDQTLRRLIASKDEPDQFAKEPLSPDNMEQEVWQDHMLSEEIGAARYKAFKKMVAILEEEKKDNKWECCKKLINSHAFGKTASAVILTEYSDTAEYVGYLAKDLGINTALIARKTTLTEQHRILDNARITPTLLVGTSAIIEQNLAFTNHLIHYDMPRSPEALLQRFAAIQTIGSRHKYFEHYFLVGRLKTDNDRLKQLMKGVQKLERE